MASSRNAAGVPKTFRGFLWSKIMDAMVGSAVAQGDIVYRGANGWTRLGAGTLGQLLQTNGASADPSWATPTPGGGGRTLRNSNTVTGAAATTLTVSSLDLNTDIRYWIEIEILGASGTPTFALSFNSDTTAANYDTQVFESSGTSNGAARANNNILLTSIVTDTTSIDAQLRNNQEVKPRMLYEYASGDGASVKRGQGVMTWRTASTNVTGITLTASVASSLGIGTSIKVYC